MNIFEETLQKTAETISAFLSRLENKQRRLDGLNGMKKEPSEAIIKMINEKALEKQDYETCEVLKECCKQCRIKL